MKIKYIKKYLTFLLKNNLKKFEFLLIIINNSLKLLNIRNIILVYKNINK